MIRHRRAKKTLSLDVLQARAAGLIKANEYGRVAASCKYWNKSPGYVAQEIRAASRRDSDWAFMARRCHHSDKRCSRACRGVRKHLWARPDHAK